MDEHFQGAIKELAGFSDEALLIIRQKCAHINEVDKHQFHQLFTSLRIKDIESATIFFRCFTYAKTEAEASTNIYSTEQVIEFTLSRLSHTKNMKYETALQLYNLECDNGKVYTIQEIEKKKTAHDTASLQIATGHAVHSTILYDQQLTMVAPTRGKIPIMMANNTGTIKNTINTEKLTKLLLLLHLTDAVKSLVAVVERMAILLLSAERKTKQKPHQQQKEIQLKAPPLHPEPMP